MFYSLSPTAPGSGGMSMSMIQARKDRRGKRAELPDEVAKRLKSCSVTNCEDWRDLSAYTTYHCFPTGDKNQDRWEIWTQLLRRARDEDTWIPFRGSLVCSHHFRPEDFVNDPLSKRRKLIKNAIPSIFPSFNVDLDDPSYQVSDDQTGEYPQGTEDNENDNSNGYIYEDANSLLDADVDPEFLNDYEYASADAPDNYNEETILQMASGSMEGEEEDDDDDVQIIDTSNEISLDRRLRLPSRFMNHSKLPARTSAQRNSTNLRRQGPHQSSTVSPASPLQTVKYTGRLRKHVSQQEETMKSLNALPFSLNPDLEIELVDPEEDLAVCRQRISELEQQNRSLITMYENTLETVKAKYETQISVLRKRLQQQDRLLANNQLSSGLSTPKKVRLS